jgi:hypothetical protein
MNIDTMQIINKIKNRSGQAMVEAMVALSVVVIGILSVFSLTSNSISLSRVAADRYVAINLASEGIELVKNLIDKNVMDENVAWNYIPGFTMSGDYEIDYNDSGVAPLENSEGDLLYFSKDGSGYYRYDMQDPVKDQLTNFRRIITINIPNPDYIHVTSKVLWKSRGNNYELSVEDYFYNLKLFKYNINVELD